MGHSVKVAEDHYLGLITVDPKATTLEQAMKIEGLAKRVVRGVSSGGRRGDAEEAA